MEEAGDQDCFELSYDRAGKVNTSLMQNCKGILLYVPTESNLLLMVLIDRYRGKAFARSIAAYCVPC